MTGILRPQEWSRHHFPGFPGGKQPLKPKEHNIKLNYNEIFKWFTKTKAKAYGKLKSNFTWPKTYENHQKIGKHQ